MNHPVDRTRDVAPPGPEDYLPAAIQKAVVRSGMTHPLTLYPVAMGIGAGVVAALFQLPTLLGLAVGLGVIGPLWAVNQVFFRHEAVGGHYLKSLHDRQKRYEAHLIDRIETGLKACAGTKSLQDSAVTGIAQLKSIQVKLANVKELLEMKLRPNELTYGRFLGAAEQVCLSVLDNLDRVVSLLTSAASIDPDYVRGRMARVTGKAAAGEADADLRRSLHERLELWDSQLLKVEQLMAGNEAAMTEMERISAAVAQWRTGRAFADGDLESAIDQLHALALQAHEYRF